MEWSKGKGWQLIQYSVNQECFFLFVSLCVCAGEWNSCCNIYHGALNEAKCIAFTHLYKSWGVCMWVFVLSLMRNSVFSNSHSHAMKARIIQMNYRFWKFYRKRRKNWNNVDVSIYIFVHLRSKNFVTANWWTFIFKNRNSFGLYIQKKEWSYSKWYHRDKQYKPFH